ncbi:Glucosaminyl phosphatidylinositol (GlcN-PI) nositol acylation protein [Entomophthora muscae]|uniref:Glucosaminyl phosphatidylinositol (GlcN-PI) nositol acylation protein n=1 Tax=Entomophthora muscae TaxID=34485 RepID=A0ACC2RN33_9FUNG|nr:Glucosaminyl phosphatidylinositol (GlcN-PI) nositol acylation protein [Entomophthora muscae]
MDYKARKELFVKDLQGADMNTVSQPIIATVVCHGLWFLVRKLSSRLGVPPSNPEAPSWIDFFLDFILICIPLLATMTGFQPQVENLNIIGSITILIASLVLRNKSKSRPEKVKLKVPGSLKSKGKQIPYISIYRSSLMIMTCIAILAVDFHVFPRFHAKVETFGSSLMDLGVGTFIFSSGLISGRGASQPSQARIKNDLAVSLIKSFPLWVIGIVRLISVKLSDYQEHVTEYGVHWNFFFTLGCLPVLVAILEIFNAGAAISGWATALLYQALLLYTPLQGYILSPTRIMGDLISMNREGLCSLFGYLAIFFVGKDLGTVVFRSSSRRPLSIEFGGRFLVYLGFYLVSYYFMGIPISRRLANFSYVAWVSCIGVAQLGGFCLINKLLDIKQVPVIHQEVNFNGLLIFLVANILTGLINMSVPTLDVSDNQAYVILTGYLFALCLLAHIFFLLKRKLI